MRYCFILFILTIPFLAHSQTVSGIATDTSNDPIVGLTIKLKGKAQITVTDSNGKFSIPAYSENDTLQFTGPNIDTLEVPVEFGKQITIRIPTKTNFLDEVQVIGYGTNTQRFNVGSVTKIKAADIGLQFVPNPLAALQGRVPGLVINATSGLPGSSFNVQIRGQNTIRNDVSVLAPRDNPLFIIDGVPFSPQNGNINQLASVASPGIGGIYNNVYGGLSPFNSLNPNDIESIEVLRDADATAIYGSRGGNGVILITTKKGSAGKTNVNLDVVTGISRTGKTMPMMNTEQYVVMRNEALANDRLEPNLILFDNGYAPDLLAFDTTRYTNWKDYFLGNTAHNTTINTAISGGTANTQFRMGAGYNKNTYVFPGDYGDTRGNFLASLHHTSLNKKLSINFSSSYSYDKNNSSGTPDLLTAFRLEPNYPSLINDHGELIWQYNGISLGIGTLDNPLTYLKNRYFIQNVNLNSSLNASYNILPDLKARISLGYNTFNSKEYFGAPKSSQNPIFEAQASAIFGVNDYKTWIVEPQIDYVKKIKKGDYSLLIGATLQRNINERTQTSGYGYISDDLIESISAAPTRYASDSYSEYKYAAIFGRISYRLNDKYLISLNARRDGSSRFGPENRFGNFGSIGAGWLFNEENFIKNHLSFLSYGKLRGSYGITGTDAVADYQYLSNWSPTNYNYDGQLGFQPTNLFNSTLRWATTKKLEAGIELGFLHDRLLASAVWYRNRSGNQLTRYTLPVITGFSSVATNWGAVVENSGVEIAVQSSVIKSNHFEWRSSFNLTVPRNKLLSFTDLETSTYNTTYVIGQSLSTILGFRYAGVNENTGTFEFYGANGDKTSTPSLPSQGRLNDYFPIGNLDPKFFGGLQNTFTVKGIQLDILLEFKKQLGVNYLQQAYSYLPGFEYNVPAALLERWQQSGDKTDIQRFSTIYGDAYSASTSFIQSSGVYSDASYIRFKHISLSYLLKSHFVQNLGINSMRVFATAQNLFTITNYSGNDPETQSIYGVPVLKTVSFGFQLNL